MKDTCINAIIKHNHMLMSKHSLIYICKYDGKLCRVLNTCIAVYFPHDLGTTFWPVAERNSQVLAYPSM